MKLNLGKVHESKSANERDVIWRRTGAERANSRLYLEALTLCVKIEKNNMLSNDTLWSSHL